MLYRILNMSTSPVLSSKILSTSNLIDNSKTIKLSIENFMVIN